jgi:anti-sigma factor RsiW
MQSRRVQGPETQCRQVAPLLETFVDGELALAETRAVEGHVEQCDSCAEQLRFAQAMKLSLRQAVKAEDATSDAFRERLTRALRAEEAREAAPSVEAVPRSGWRPVAQSLVPHWCFGS